jgi:flavin reductase (DIM6/NTAB) family NADH-FMN oxidoreductase RutF
MPKQAEKVDLPVAEIRRYLEPGPIVLVSSAAGGERNIMTMGWHTVMEFTPALVGCVISSANYSFGLILESGECVINLPTTELTDAVVGIGNTSGNEIDKFATFGLTAAKATRVNAPLIAECHANLECRLKGGFKQSSQHPDVGGCDEHWKAAVGSVWTSAITVTRSAACDGAQ